MKARDDALARAITATTEPETTPAAREAAWLQELVEQIRRNTATIWTLASALGMIAAGWFGLLLLHAVAAPDVSRELDIIITGIAIGGGSKPLHDLIENIKKSKEEKENPNETDGQSAS